MSEWQDWPASEPRNMDDLRREWASEARRFIKEREQWLPRLGMSPLRSSNKKAD